MQNKTKLLGFKLKKNWIIPYQIAMEEGRALCQSSVTVFLDDIAINTESTIKATNDSETWQTTHTTKLVWFKNPKFSLPKLNTNLAKYLKKPQNTKDQKQNLQVWVDFIGR